MAMGTAKQRALREEIQRHQKLDLLEMKRGHIQRKNEFVGLRRFAQRTKIELEDEERMDKEKRETVLRQHKLQHEEALARELDEIKRKDMAELKNRQLLRENCPQLRDLESRLRAAYINKEVQAQLAEKRLEKLQEKTRQKEASAVLVQALYKDEEIKRMSVEQETMKKSQYKQELQDQMILQEQMRRFQFEEFLREKKMLDDVIQRIHEEDERIREEKYCKLLKTREELAKFKEAQEIWRQRERKELEAEHRRIEEYLMQQSKEFQRRQESKAQKQDAKSKICNEIARKMYAEETARRDRVDILQELLEQELIDKEDSRHREEMDKLFRQRLMNRQELASQIRDREERVVEQARQDREYKEQLIAQAMEEERLSQLSNEKRRLKMIQLRKDCEQVMIDRRQKQAEEMQRRIQVKELEMKDEENRNRLIEAERIRMLQEHAENLIGFMPRGILREEDMEYLPGQISDYYKK